MYIINCFFIIFGYNALITSLWRYPIKQNKEKVMNYRTILLASAAVMFAGSAMAADLTNPFYLPGKGQVTSDTRIEYNRDKTTGGNWDGLRAAEEITYGVNDNLAVFGAISNEFDSEGMYNNDHNFGYELGASYNIKSDKILAQVSASYSTLNPKDFYGKHNAKLFNDGNDRWEKYLSGELKLGYDMGDGLTPYAAYGLDGKIDAADRGLEQYALLGIHKYAGNWAVDGAVRYDFETDGKNTNEWWLQAEADYYVKENIALGVYGDYFLAGTGSDDIDYDYTAGIRAKVQF